LGWILPVNQPSFYSLSDPAFGSLNESESGIQFHKRLSAGCATELILVAQPIPNKKRSPSFSDLYLSRVVIN
jgi:hypothetical protein